MPRYTLDKYISETCSDIQEKFKNDKIKKEHKYLNVTKSKGDLEDVTGRKREFISSYLNARKDHSTRSDAGDSVLASEERQYPWIKEGFDVLKSLEIESYSKGQGDDHFLQVLNATAPNTEETAVLLDQVMDLTTELEGKIRELSDFREEIRGLGKLLKVESSRLLQEETTSQSQASP